MTKTRDFAKVIAKEHPRLAEEAAIQAQVIRTCYLIGGIRVELGLTQKELAARAGVTQAHISKIESGCYVGVSLAMLVRLGKAMGRKLVISLADKESTTASLQEAACSWEGSYPFAATESGPLTGGP